MHARINQKMTVDPVLMQYIPHNCLQTPVHPKQRCEAPINQKTLEKRGQKLWPDWLRLWAAIYFMRQVLFQFQKLTITI